MHRHHHHFSIVAAKTTVTSIFLAEIDCIYPHYGVFSVNLFLASKHLHVLALVLGASVVPVVLDAALSPHDGTNLEGLDEEYAEVAALESILAL